MEKIRSVYGLSMKCGEHEITFNVFVRLWQSLRLHIYEVDEDRDEK